MCDVAFGENTFSGDLTQYSIKINPDDFDGFGFNINLESTIAPYRPQDGIINAGEDYFAWFAAVPNGNVSGDLTYDGKTIDIKGKVIMIIIGATFLFKDYSIAGYGLEGLLGIIL